MPALLPASVPTHCEATPGFALTLALASSRLLTTPALPMLANSPMFCVVESDGLIVRLPIVWPWPSKMVLSGALVLPSGAKFAIELASMSLPRA